jgi:hypothetical protein
VTPGTGCAPIPGGVRCSPPGGLITETNIALGDGSDALRGLWGVVDAGTGDDSVTMGYGIVDGGPGADAIAGTDPLGVVVDYSKRTSAVHAALGGGADDGEAGEGDSIDGHIGGLLGGSGPDTLSLAGIPATDLGHARVQAGAGDDAITGSDVGDTLAGGAGDDTLAGGGGGDELDPGPGSDQVSGGPGIDAVDYHLRTEGLAISLDDRAGDGAAGENGNIRSDVEDVTGGRGPDTLIGTDDRNDLQGGAGDNVLVGLGGDDQLETDRTGRSTLVAGRGFDTVVAGGHDAIDVRDGQADVVRCSEPPPRSLRADPSDYLSRCVSFALVLRPLLVRPPRHGRVAVGVRCARVDARRCDGVVELAGRGGVLARGRYRLRPGRRERVSLRLTRGGRREARRHRVLFVFTKAWPAHVPRRLIADPKTVTGTWRTR